MWLAVLSKTVDPAVVPVSDPFLAGAWWLLHRCYPELLSRKAGDGVGL